ncbi:hypothetical protein TI05_09150 [Achromatium sp. WMS3]|nr:hypothetical protein TI05_09150 [Achromatium sp. WMS3]
MNTVQAEYEKDFYSWIYRNINLLRQHNFEALDIDILIDELESMAKGDRRKLISHLMVLISHLLKWQFQPEQRSGSWRGSIRKQRIQIRKQLEDSPSLKNQLVTGINSAYPDSLKLAIEETGLKADTFPDECPYSITQLLNDDFYPQSGKV